jgi:galactokinase/mevalonate kinase-like predicted kinase
VPYSSGLGGSSALTVAMAAALAASAGREFGGPG